MLNLIETEHRIIEFIQKTVAEAGAKGAVVGVSGGIDSAVVAALLIKALGKKHVLGLLLPCGNCSEDLEDGHLLANHLDMEHIRIDLTQTYQAFLKDNGETHKATLCFGNIKPRLRMTTLYFHGAKRGYLVAGTSNKSELVTGYLTKYGDGGVDFEPIADLLKEDVFEMARQLNLPEKLIAKAPTAGLFHGQTDEKELGFTYHQLDRFIQTGEGDEELKNKILRMYSSSRHKTTGPVMLNLDRKFYL